MDVVVHRITMADVVYKHVSAAKCHHVQQRTWYIKYLKEADKIP